MLRTYEFCAEKPIQFDDERTVGELIQYAFDEFDYYEPFGMDIVTCVPELSSRHFHRVVYHR